MIEVIYKEDREETEGNEEGLSIPRNIRQIGLINGKYRIYMEDYVYTFLSRLSETENSGEKSGKLAVLTGETKWSRGIFYFFIKGALAVDDTEAAAEHIDFSEEVWANIYENQDHYFPGQEIVGWYFSQAQIPMRITEVLEKVHLRHFGGEKVLMLKDPVEKEEAFFCYENNVMEKQAGYYIYYEKNPSMREYMMEKKETLSAIPEENVEDEAVKNFRTIINQKKETENTSAFSYAATACLAVAILAVGVGFYRNYQRFQAVKQETKAASAMVAEDYGVTPPAEEPSVTPKENDLMEENTQTNLEHVENEEQNRVIDIEENEEPLQEEADTRKMMKKEREALQNKGEELSVTQQEQTEETSVEPVHETYVIRPGDTLYQISIARYGNMDAVQEICRLNNLTENQVIYPGQVLVLP